VDNQVGDYHTHGDYTYKDHTSGEKLRVSTELPVELRAMADNLGSENFSKGDIQGGISAARLTKASRQEYGEQYTLYLGTPYEGFKPHVPETRHNR